MRSTASKSGQTSWPLSQPKVCDAADRHPIAGSGAVRHWPAMASHLLAILHSLPVGTGLRTTRRVEIAQRALGCDSFSIVNVYPAALTDSNALSLQSASATFARGRELILRELEMGSASDVLLAYGVQLPTGPIRHEYRAQTHWLTEELECRNLRVWSFGGRPSHPSRWHRLVSREHPGSSVESRAGELLVRSDRQAESPSSSHPIDTIMLSSGGK
ncbi:DUF1643 domain-containing protein [Microbacterium sp. CJ88]|uniref:DUF1643 domain-containing protein n=1 Tax=Microbacterium sp. CJ88 TaxID=3445672 RepID=UPI003F6569F1